MVIWGSGNLGLDWVRFGRGGRGSGNWVGAGSRAVVKYTAFVGGWVFWPKIAIYLPRGRWPNIENP